MKEWLGLLLFWLALFAAFGLVVGGLAARKGYNFLVWFFAAGILSLIVLAFLPFTNKPDIPPEAAFDQRIQGNMIAGILAITRVMAGLMLLSAM